TGGGFAPPVAVPLGTSLAGVASVDLDGDGDLDLVTANRHHLGGFRDNVSVLFNSGAGTFPDVRNYGAGSDPLSGEPGALGLDGDLDLVVVNETSGDLSLLSNAGGGTFAAARRLPVGLLLLSAAACDIDGDGLPDLAAAVAGQPGLVVFTNQGGGKLVQGPAL